MNRTDESGEFWNRMQWDHGKWRFIYDISKAVDAAGDKLPAWSQMVKSAIAGTMVHGSLLVVSRA